MFGSLEADLHILQSMARELRDYVTSDTLFWTLDITQPGGATLPRMTISGFLMRDKAVELRSLFLTPEQAQAWRQARETFDTVRRTYNQAYSSKVQRELVNLLERWTADVQDWDNGRFISQTEYGAAAINRGAVEILLHELPAPPPGFTRRLEDTDRRLQSVFASGPSIWPRFIEPAFPRASCWWAYGQPKPED